MTCSRFDFVRRGPSFSSQAATSNSISLKSVQRQLHVASSTNCMPCMRHATLSLSEVPGCESSMMKAWLSCLESARMSVGAAIGSMASIFDVFMVGGGRQRGRSSREGEFSVGPLLLGLPRRDLACEFGAPPQSHMPIFSSVTLLVRRQSVCRPITPFWPCPYTYSDFESADASDTSVRVFEPSANKESSLFTLFCLTHA